jgi:hypothetical protein
MRLLARLEYEPESCASWYVIFRQSPKRTLSVPAPARPERITVLK